MQTNIPQVIRNMDVQSSPPQALKDSEAVEKLLPVTDFIQQRKILYYSDFDINVNDWKKEKESLKLFSSTLFKALRNASIEL